MCVTYVFSILLLCVILPPSSAVDGEDKLVIHEHAAAPPSVFPNKSAPSTPILEGSNPAQTNLPPKVFPTASPSLNTSAPPILSGTAEDLAEIKSNHELTVNTTVNTTHKTESPTKFTDEQEDMLHSKYTGGHDVDEIWDSGKKPSDKEEKKASEKDEKKSTFGKKDPKSEVDVDPKLDKKGPKMMNETKTKSGESVLESTSKMMAMSSSMLSSTAQVKHHGLIEPVKTAATVVLSVVVVLCMGLVGLLIWKRIAVRKFGRDILINEDDFDEVSDMHTFESAQIQIT